MFDGLFSQLATQIPSLTILVIIVCFFLRYLIKRDEVLKDISERCHEVQRDAIKTMHENSKALGEISIILRRINGK